MSNMSYCRFHNTLLDLQDCSRALAHGEGDDDELSLEEKVAKKRLLKLCAKLAREYEDELEE